MWILAIVSLFTFEESKKKIDKTPFPSKQNKKSGGIMADEGGGNNCSLFV